MSDDNSNDLILGDQAFLNTNNRSRHVEMTYGGALSFLRRPYSRDLSDVDVVVSGVPYDGAVTFRPGCRLGPQGIRAASVQLAELEAFPFGFDPFDALSVVDYGDCFINPHQPNSVADTIVAHAKNILSSGAKMLTLGGDHFVSYPLLKAHAEHYGEPIALIQFDAHCDTWPDEDPLNHGTMMLRAKNEGIIDVDHSVQVGLRTYNDSAHGFEILTSPWIHRNGIDKTIAAIKERVGNKPVYISFDIDVLDPAFAPGTGTPVPGGLASWQALEIMRSLDSLNLIGMDLVEVSPPFDQSEITAIAAASIAHDWLCLLAKKSGLTENPIGKV